MASIAQTPIQLAPHQDGKYPPPKKRIVVCCDGTWLDAAGAVETPSNVTRIERAISPVGTDQATGQPISQVTYYHDGVGTGHEGWYNQYIGGATGEGLSLNIREAYAFICSNYYPGDEIFLLGFSRGSFTARSISSLINELGLLTMYGLNFLIQIFEDWEYQLKANWRTKYPNEPWKNRPKFDHPDYKRKLLELGLTRPDIPIKCVAVWDTVGGLGIPKIALLPQPASTDYSFVNSIVSDNIEYAFHALSLDERRSAYRPTVWEQPDKTKGPKVLKQTWFPGVHSDIGGSYADDDLADLTLAWMCGQLDHYKLLSFDEDYIFQLIRRTIERHSLGTLGANDGEPTPGKLARTSTFAPLRAWGLGCIHDSLTLFFRLGGVKNRTPAEYHRIDVDTGYPTNERLQNTNECVHASVRVRMGQSGLGYNDKGLYESEALRGWKMYGIESDPGTAIARSLPGQPGKMKDVIWKKTVPINDKAAASKEAELVMPEDHFTRIERMVLRRWHTNWEQTADKREEEFDTTRPPPEREGGGHRANTDLSDQQSGTKIPVSAVGGTKDNLHIVTSVGRGQ